MAMPTYEQLIAFAAGELAGVEAAAVAAHVQRDAKAAAVVNTWQSVHATLRTDDSSNPSAAAVQRARAIFAQRATAAATASIASTWLETAQRFIARLVYDSRLHPAGVRFAGDDDRVNFTFETEGGEIDLQAERMADEDSGAQRWRVVGQISESSARPHEVALAQRGSREPVAMVAADEHGGFVLEAKPGTYDLLIHCGMEAAASDRVIVISPLELS